MALHISHSTWCIAYSDMSDIAICDVARVSDFRRMVDNPAAICDNVDVLKHCFVGKNDVCKHWSVLWKTKMLSRLLIDRDVAREITRGMNILKHFQDYIRVGYYPFYKEDRETYYERLRSVVRQVLEVDLPTIEDVTAATVAKAKKMLAILADSVPQTPKMACLYRELETDRNQGLKLLKALARGGLLGLLSSEKATLKEMSRPDKIYLDNTNLMYALSADVNSGCRRETFFLNQLRAAGHEVTYPAKGDFLVDGRYLFEVGGPGKGFDQIKDMPNSYVVNDDVETGIGNKIPLWLFGFLY